MLVSEHVYCVAIAFNLTEWIEQKICIKFCMKLEQSSVETTLLIQKATGMGNWWLTASSWQRTHSCIISHTELFGETSNHPGESVPLQPRFGILWLLAFPQTKITFEREEISGRRWGSGKCSGAADGDWENSVRSQGAYFEGDWGIIVLCTMFLVSCIFFNKCLFVILHGCILSGHASYVPQLNQSRYHNINIIKNK